jgi:hypothetical protein
MGITVSVTTFVLGVVLVVFGWMICLAAVVRRHYTLPSNRRFGIGGEFAACLGASFVGCLLGAIGFWAVLSRVQFGEVLVGFSVTQGMSEVLTVLALLTGGAFAGFCAVDFQKARADEQGLLDMISCLFTTLFFTLFFLLVLCLGNLPACGDQLLRILIAFGMFLLLATFTLLDYWNYRMPEKAD